MLETQKRPGGNPGAGIIQKQSELNCKATPSSSPAETLLPLLAKVRRTGPGRWIACCAGHYDRHPSLLIRETADGTLLLHCYTGCTALDVISACGLDLKDLFPRRFEHRPLRRGERWVPADVLRALAKESLIVVIAAEALARGDKLGRADIDRVARAGARFQAAAQEVSHGR